MANFIEVHGDLISIEDIRKLEFISDDIYLGLFPKNAEGKIFVDYITFTYAKLYLFSGEDIELTIELYQPEEGYSIDEWAKLNRAYINKSMESIKKAIGDITTVTGFEYEHALYIKSLR